jgi:hypothetical protein
MSIKVKCEACGAALKVKDGLAGKKGNCPQCKAPLQIPALDAAESDANPGDVGPGEISEEEAIFGKGFFDAAAPSPRPRKIDLSAEIDDDAAPSPVVAESKPAKKKPGGPAAAMPSSTENAADIAGSLLSKTGKKNRPEDLEDENANKVEYDFSEINYLLKTRVLPSVGAIVAAILLYFWLSASGSNLPPLAEVRGRVTVNGQPFPAQLMFSPSDQNAEGSGAIGQCNPDGTYEVYYNADAKGAVIGPNTIRIIAGSRPFIETREIVDGLNELNFDLKTE